MTPRPRPTPVVGYQPLTEEDLKKQLQRSTQSLLTAASPEGNWVRIAPEGSSQKSVESADPRDTRRLSSASLASVPEGKKVI